MEDRKMSELEKKSIDDEALESVDGGFVIPRPKPTDMSAYDDSPLIRIAQHDSDDGAI